MNDQATFTGPGIRIRGGSGLGDSLYIRPVAEHFLRRGDDVTVNSNYADVFHGLPVKIEPFSRAANVLAHYSRHRARVGTTQFDDVCETAGIGRVPLAFQWPVRNAVLVRRLLLAAEDRPLVLVHGGREPWGRQDGLGLPLLPERAAFEAVLEQLAHCFTVWIGAGPRLYRLRVDEDLGDRTSVSDLLDLGCACDGVVSQVSFCVPLAEVFDKPLLTIWSASGLKARRELLRQITPQKVLSKPEIGRFVMDDWSAERLSQGVRIWETMLERTRACAS